MPVPQVFDITLLDSPDWTLHPVYCTNVHIHDMQIENRGAPVHRHDITAIWVCILLQDGSSETVADRVESTVSTPTPPATS